MPTISKPGSMWSISKLVLIGLCVLCLLPLCSCVSKTGDEGAIEQAIKYASNRLPFDMPASSAIATTPDAKVDITLLSFEDTPNGGKIIELEPAVISDTMASWSADDWAANQDDLFYVLVAHFKVICKQAHEFGGVPEEYTVTNPDYMVVYDSKKSEGFIVAATGVYKKTDDPENPIGETIVLVAE